MSAPHSTRPHSTPEERWLQCIQDWYPQRLSQTYFLPPFHFRRTRHEVVGVPGVPVDVLPVLQPVPHGSVATAVPLLYPPTQRTQPPLHVAGRIFSLPQGAPTDLPRYQDSDFVDDEAAERVLGCLRSLSEAKPEAMLVISQLKFRHFLDGCVDPIEAAYCASLPRPSDLPSPSNDGDFDVLVVHRRYGLMVLEVKTVGAHRGKASDLQRAVKKKVGQAIEQLNKAERVICHLLSGLHQTAKDKIEKDIKQLNKADGMLHHLLFDLHQAAKNMVGKVNNQLNKEEAELRHLPSDIDQAAKDKVHQILEHHYKVAGVPGHLLSHLTEVSEGKVLETIEQVNKAEGELLHVLTDRHQAVTDIEHLNEAESAPNHLLSHLKEVYKDKVGKAIEQLNKAEGELRHLVFELQAVKDKVGKSLAQLNNDKGQLPHLRFPGVRITKTVVLPNLTSGELLQAIGGDTQLESDLCRCLGRLGDLTAAIKRCLCKEKLQSVSQPSSGINQPSQPSGGGNQPSQPSSGINQPSQPSGGINQPSQPSGGINQPSQSSSGGNQPGQPFSGGNQPSRPSRIWWQHMTTYSAGPDPAISNTVYDCLLARFCGPATSVEVATVSASHRAVITGKGKKPKATKMVGNLGDAVAEAGLILSTLVLYPEQVALLSDPSLRFLHMHGPPGTGKTLMLVVKAIQKLHQRHNVLIVSTWDKSRAVSFLMEKQLQHAIGPNMGTVYLHDVQDFAQPEDVTALATADGNLFIISDEASFESSLDSVALWMKLWIMINTLPGVSVWCTTGSKPTFTPPGMVVRTLTVSLRTPPAVTRLTQKAITDMCDPNLAYTYLLAHESTDGAPVRWLEHSPGSRGHSAGRIMDCEECAFNIVLLLAELGVGYSTGADALHYRDVLMFSRETDHAGMRRALSAHGVPAQILDGSETSQRDVALATSDTVAMGDQYHALGLERRVVIVLVELENGGRDVGDTNLGKYWMAASRCTGQLVFIRHTL